MSERLKLRRDTLFIKADKAIIFRTKDSTFALKGATIYDTFRKLLPYLDGSLDVETLLQRVRDDNRTAVGDLVAVLHKRGVLLAVDPEDALALDRQTREAFAQQIGFIEHFADRPHARFGKFRSQRILLRGRGAAFVAAGKALLRNGLEVLDAESGPHDAALEEEADRQTRRDLASRVVCHSADALADMSRFDVVLYCAERPRLSDVLALNQAARAQGFVFLPAIMHGTTSLTGPMVRPDGGACWLCAMLRWTDNARPADGVKFWRALVTDTADESREPRELAARILGNTAAMEVFTFATAMTRPESDEHVLEQNVGTLKADVLPLLAHPDCPLCAPLEMPAATASPAAQDDPSALLKYWNTLMDHSFALLRGYRDETLEQAPLRISALALPGAQSPVLSWSINNSDEARLDALFGGIRAYADRHAAAHLKHRLNPADGDAPSIAPAQVWGWLGNAGDDALSNTLVGQDLDGAPVRVPAAAVSLPFDTEGHFDPNNGGTGVGRSLAEAVENGTLSLCHSRLARLLVDGDLVPRRWMPDDDIANDAAYRYLMAAVRAVTPSEPIIAVAHAEAWAALVLADDGDVFDLNEIIMAAHFSQAVAVKNALMTYLAKEQFLEAGQAWPAARCTAGPSLVRLGPDHDAAGPLRGTFDDFVGRLKARGGGLYWVDIAPPDIAATKTVRVVKVLLAEPLGVEAR